MTFNTVLGRNAQSHGLGRQQSSWSWCVAKQAFVSLDFGLETVLQHSTGN